MLDRLIQTLDGLGMARRTQVALLGGVGLLALWGVFGWATRPQYVTAYSGMDLQDAGRVSQLLDEQGIAFRMERGGSELQVPTDQLVPARIALAEQGIPQTGRPGFELFDTPNWGMTDFAQKVNYRRALEGELERTIERMEGVEAAKVHLALEESRAFRRADTKAEASVVLSLRSGRAAGTDMVRSITHLIGGAVDGITSDHVTVVDASGRVLSASIEDGSSSALSLRQLEARRDVERHLEAQARRLLDQVVGAGNAEVRVAANLNFDQLARTTQAVDPEAQAIVGEDRAEIIPDAGGTGGAASVQSSTQFDVTRSVEQFSQGPGTLQRMTVSVVVNAVETVAEDGTVTYEDRTPAELDQIETVVANAVGVDANRGDQISVVSLPFSTTQALDMPSTGLLPRILEWVQVLQKPVVGLIGLLLMFFMALKLLRSVRDMPAPEPRLVPGQAGGAGPLPAAGVSSTGGSLSGGDIRQRIAARVSDDPSAAARAVGSWLKES